MKSKHRETLHRNPKCRIYSKVKIPFYVSPKTLREVLPSELECAKPDSNATVLDSPPVSSLCRRTCTAFAAQPGSEPKSRWAGDEWEEWDGLMVPPSPASAGRILCLHPTTLSTLARTVREEGAKTVVRLASQRAKDNPYFVKILPTARSTPSWLLCISRDTERPRMGKDAWTLLLPSGLLTN